MSHKPEKDKPATISEEQPKPKRTRTKKIKPNISESVADSVAPVPEPAKASESESNPTPAPTSTWRDISRKQLGALIASGGGAVSLVLTLVTTSYQLAGVITMELALTSLLFAWVVVVAGIITMEWVISASWKRSITVVSMTAIISGIVLSYTALHLVRERARLDKQAEIKTSISQRTVTDYGSISLKPANEPTPNLPPDCMTEGDTAVFLGNELVLTKAQSAIIIKVDEEPVLSFRKAADGIKFNAIVRNQANQQVVTIVENVFSVLPNSGYRVLKENESTLVVFTPENEEALYVKLLNPSVLLVRGIFFSPKTGKSFNIKDEVKLGRKIRMDCMRSEGNGSLFGL